MVRVTDRASSQGSPPRPRGRFKPELPPENEAALIRLLAHAIVESIKSGEWEALSTPPARRRRRARVGSQRPPSGDELRDAPRGEAHMTADADRERQVGGISVESRRRHA